MALLLNYHGKRLSNWWKRIHHHDLRFHVKILFVQAFQKPNGVILIPEHTHRRQGSTGAFYRTLARRQRSKILQLIPQCFQLSIILKHQDYLARHDKCPLADRRCETYLLDQSESEDLSTHHTPCQSMLWISAHLWIQIIVSMRASCYCNVPIDCR